MIRRTKEYILENKMIKNHSTVLVALSGGADVRRDMDSAVVVVSLPISMPMLREASTSDGKCTYRNRWCREPLV